MAPVDGPVLLVRVGSKRQVDVYTDRFEVVEKGETQTTLYSDIGHVAFVGEKTLVFYTRYQDLDLPWTRMDLPQFEAQEKYDEFVDLIKSANGGLVSTTRNGTTEYTQDVFDWDAHQVSRVTAAHPKTGNHTFSNTEIDVFLDDQCAYRIQQKSPTSIDRFLICQAGPTYRPIATTGDCLLALRQGPNLLEKRSHDFNLFTGDAVFLGRGLFPRKPLIRKRRPGDRELYSEFALLGRSIRVPGMPQLGYYGDILLDEQVIGRFQHGETAMEYEIQFHQPTNVLVALAVLLVGAQITSDNRCRPVWNQTSDS